MRRTDNETATRVADGWNDPKNQEERAMATQYTPTTDNSGVPWQLSKPEKLSKQFTGLGWLGFEIQLAMLAIPLLLLF
jgi:hypothetical protein